MRRRPPRERRVSGRHRQVVYPAFIVHGPAGWEWNMKTTLDLPDELMREIKVKAAREDRKLSEVLRELLGVGLSSRTPARRHRRAKLPVLHFRSPIPGQQLTSEMVADLLLQQDDRGLLGS